MLRYALITTTGSLEQIERYLPGNYAVIYSSPFSGHPANTSSTREIVIQGEDNSGWTLDGYVIPRLASGLHFAKEIDLSHPIMKTIPDPS